MLFHEKVYRINWRVVIHRGTMETLVKITAKLLCTVFVFFAITLGSFAANTSLSGIEVNKQADGVYKIILKTDKKTQIKKVMNEQDRTSVLLNSTLPSEPMDIYYDNDSAFTNVIVQKKNNNNTLVLFEGENIGNSQIYTKELSTGQIKPIEDVNAINNIFFVADKKLLVASLSAVMLFFLIMLLSRPKSKRYSSVDVKNVVNRKRQTGVNTLRNKNLSQSRNIPSINSSLNGSFNSAKMYMTTPNELVVNDSYEEEEIRKAG